MVTIEKVDLKNKKQVERFIRLPHKLYADCPQWVPLFDADMRVAMNPQKHPFYEHSEVVFFLATRNGEDVGRIAFLQNKPFNVVHNAKDAEFYFFDSINDQEVADALFNRIFEEARARGLDHIVGPKGLSPFDGYGIQIEGFEHHQMMIMMNYNFPYYNDLVTKIGFTKEVDFVSCYLNYETFKIPEKIHKAAEIVKKRGSFEIVTFKSKKDLLSLAPEIGRTYNKCFVKNWEYYPLTEREVDYAVKNVLSIADPRLIKIIRKDGEIVGFLLAFPDITPAIQKGKGKLTPVSIIRMLLETKRTKWVSLNGAGVLPEYQGLGGNALLYLEMIKTMTDFHFEHAELTQVAETAQQMRKDLITSGGVAYKNHRVYQIHI